MKMFSQKEINEKIVEFNGYVTQELLLQEELLTLDISGSKERVKKMARRQMEIIKEIEDLRMNKMMPILEEMTKFIAYCQKVEKGEIKLGDPWPGDVENAAAPAETAPKEGLFGSIKSFFSGSKSKGLPSK